MSNTENDYSDLVIVAEDEWYSRKQERTTMCIYNTLWEIKENLSRTINTIDRVFCRKFLAERENCHAEVLFIKDNALSNKVRKKFIIAANEDDNDGVAVGRIYHHSVVIRVFEKKQKILKEFDDRSAAE